MTVFFIPALAPKWFAIPIYAPALMRNCVFLDRGVLLCLFRLKITLKQANQVERESKRGRVGEKEVEKNGEGLMEKKRYAILFIENSRSWKGDCYCIPHHENLFFLMVGVWELNETSSISSPGQINSPLNRRATQLFFFFRKHSATRPRLKQGENEAIPARQHSSPRFWVAVMYCSHKAGITPRDWTGPIYSRSEDGCQVAA